MAQAWTPPRRVIGSAPVARALTGVSDQMFAQFVDWSEEEIQAEHRRQVSNGSIAIEKERQNLAKMMAENSKDPASYRTKFAESKAAIQKSVLAGITQPDAKQAVEMELNESFQAWEGWLGQNAAKQTAVNTNADYGAGLTSLYESRQYVDDSDMLAHLSAGLTHVEQGYNGGKLPVDKLPTRDVAELEKRKLTRHIVGNYLLQQALAGDDETIIERANDVAPRSILDDQRETPLFGPEDLAELKKRYAGAANAAKAEVEDKRKAQSDVDEKEYTDLMLKGQFTKPDKNGNPVHLRDWIIGNQSFNPGLKRTLEEELNDQINSRKTAKVYTEAEKLEAKIEISIEADPVKKLALLRKHAPGLGYTEVKGIYEKMQNPAADDSKLADGLNRAVGAIRDIRKEAEKDIRGGIKEEGAAKREIDLLRLQNKVLGQWEAHPEWTEKQRIDEMESILAPAKDEAAKETVKGIDRWVRMMSWAKPKGIEPVGDFLLSEPQEQIPPGLEKHWSKLAPERREKIRKLLARGVSVNRIIETLEK